MPQALPGSDFAATAARGSSSATSAARAAGFYGKWLPHLAVGPGQRPGSYAEFGKVLAPHLRSAEGVNLLHRARLEAPEC